jgi:hypothetical protein
MVCFRRYFVKLVVARVNSGHSVRGCRETSPVHVLVSGKVLYSLVVAHLGLQRRPPLHAGKKQAGRCIVMVDSGHSHSRAARQDKIKFCTTYN